MGPHRPRAGRILVHSPKTEHHEGGATREIPLFDELVPHIDAWWDACPERSEHVIVSNRGTEAAWRQRLRKLCRKLGIPVWPRVFHNLRASRQTELEKVLPTHVVCAFMGNSPEVSRAHYLMVTDDDFRQAAKAPDTASAKAAQNPAQKAPERDGMAQNGAQSGAKKPEKCVISRVLTGADGNRTHLAPLQTPHRV